MGVGRSKDLVAAAALCSAAGLGAFLLLRSRATFGTHWTDGERSFASETGAGVRHAVWDGPRALPELGEARDPTLSPDGRWLVFTSGERGLNADLFVCELGDDGPGPPRPLVALNSSADELAPAFGADGLTFASDRPGGAGGLDLWRADHADGTFGPAEPVAPGVNSSADETDPAVLAGELVFASNRARADFDLYRARPDAQGFLEVEPLQALNGPSEEREPAWTADGRCLYFASDRDGPFRLYRARCLGVRCLGAGETPEPVLDPAREARGPWLADDGFELWFEAPAADGTRALERARSLEIFRVPPAAVSLAEWLTLAGLLLLALLALLAKRWGALDVLYRCVLVSLILHLLLLLYLRTVSPDEKRYEPGAAESPTFRVRLEPAAPVRLEARRGPALPSSPERVQPATPAERASAPPMEALAEPEPSEAAAPARVALEASTLPAEPVRLAERGERERIDAASPGLALPTPSSASVRARTAEPRRAAALPGEAEPAEPTSIRLAERAASAAALEEASSPAPLRAREPAAAPVPLLAAPRATSERASASAPELVLADARAGSDASTGSGRRAESSELARAVTGLPAASSGPDAPAEHALTAPSAEPAGAPAPLPLAAGERDGPAPAFRAPAEARPASRASASFDATADLASASASASASPERSAAPSAPVRALAGLPPERPIEPGPASHLVRSEVEPSLPSAPPLAGTLARADSGGAPRVDELRSPPPAAGEPTEKSASPRFDALLGLAGTSAAAERAPEAPRRAAPVLASAERPLRASPPDARPLVRSPSEPARDLPSPPRLAESPYQNRFGDQKLRALEEFGGSAETEHAVAAGLVYLARIQAANGAWGQRSDAHSKYLDVRVGKTGLALLAFLGAGHVPGGSTEHAEVSAHAVRFLLESQDPASGQLGRACSYGHGIAAYALAECFALTRAPELRAPLERAVARILAAQDGRSDPRFAGGWGYYFADGHVWNGDEWPRASVTAWQVMALESARLGGLAVPAEAFAGARTFLANTWDAERGAFRYDHDPERLDSGYPILPASTPAAMFALSLLSVDVSGPELAAARRFVLTRLPDGYHFTGADDFVFRARGNLYFWYYATLALFRVGGRPWETWNEALKATLLPAQAEDGSWQPIDVYAEYAGDDDAERTYTTAMCVLSLEIYYRYFTPLLEVR